MSSLADSLKMAALHVQDVVVEAVDVQKTSLPAKDAVIKGNMSPVKPHNGNSKVGTVIGIIANGFSGLQHNGTNGHITNGHQNLNSQLG